MKMPDMEPSGFFDTNRSTPRHGAPLLEGFSAENFETLLSGGKTRRLSPGETLVAEGQGDTDMYILMEGEVEVSAPLNQGWVQLAVLGPGSVIGEMAFLDNLPRSARVIARTVCSALRITRESFQEFAQQEPRLAMVFVLELSRIMAGRLRRVERFDAAEAAREQARKALAAELHDQTLSDLASIAIELSFLARHASQASEDLQSGVQQVRDRLKDTERGLREIVRGIYPQTLSTLGLVPAVNALLRDLSTRAISSTYPLKVHLEVRGFDKERVPEEVEISVYRVIQQGLDNIIQHAGTTNVNIDLAWSDSELTLSLADDGVGFDVDNPRESPSTGHFGLVNLRDRIEQLLGTIHMESTLGKGTTLRARIPVINDVTRPTEAKISSYVLDNRPSTQEVL